MKLLLVLPPIGGNQVHTIGGNLHPFESGWLCAIGVNSGAVLKVLTHRHRVHLTAVYPQQSSAPDVFSMVYINTLMIQDVLKDEAWLKRLAKEDYRGLTPLFYSHVEPYGMLQLDMTKRLALA